jgi:FKBP-type peptidyl-prolyl cis-trans isomerase 2
MYGEFKINRIEGTDVYVDVNHQLAGKTLIFDIFPLSIKK